MRVAATIESDFEKCYDKFWQNKLLGAIYKRFIVPRMKRINRMEISAPMTMASGPLVSYIIADFKNLLATIFHRSVAVD